MITNFGKNIIAKYLVAETNSYASYVAVGCGELPFVPGSSIDYSARTELTFETIRGLITSSNYILDEEKIRATVAITSGNSLVTVTTLTAHGLIVGDSAVLSGFNYTVDAFGQTVPAPNGTFPVLSVTSTTFTLDIAMYEYFTTTYTFNAGFGTAGYSTSYLPKIALTAKFPKGERFEISELGLYPSGSNQYSSGTDSQILLGFTRSESWAYNTPTTSADVPYPSSIDDASNTLTFPSEKAMFVDSNSLFFNAARIGRQERPRFKSTAIAIDADLSVFTALKTATAATSNYISLPFTTTLSSNSSSDVIKVAYSVVNKVTSPSSTWAATNLMLQFMCSNGTDNAIYHFRDTSPSQTNRYKVLSLTLGETTNATRTSEFSWDDVVSVRVYGRVDTTATISTAAASTDYAIMLDGIRFDNKSNVNPLYGLVSYSIVNSSGVPMVMNKNSDNMIEYRFTLAVG
jgi:hypothetical protein